MKTKLLIAFLFLSAFANAQYFQWAKNIGGTGSENSQSIATDAAGNVYTTGCFSGTVDFDPGIGVFNLTSAGSLDIFISKLDSSGNFLWAKAMGGVGYDGGNSIITDTQGNVFITGSFWGIADFDPGPAVFNLTWAGGNYSDVFICKLDAAGNFVWAKPMGGIKDDSGASITTDIFGNVLMTGAFHDTADFDPGPGIFNLICTVGTYSDIFICKLDALGNFVWAKAMGGIKNDVGFSIKTNAFGNVFTTGTFSNTVDFDPGVGTFNLTSAGYDDFFISKLDASGNFIWAKAMGGATYDDSRSISLDVFGNIFTTGAFGGTADFDPGIGVFNLTATSSGWQDIFISKLDSSGNFVWAKKMGGKKNDVGRSIAIDVAGNIYASGDFIDTADFDPSPGTFNLEAVGLSIFVSKLDSSGNLIWAKKMQGIGGSPSYNFGYSISIDSYGNVHTTGVFSGTGDFDPGTGMFNLTSNGLEDVFIIKLTQDSCSNMSLAIDSATDRTCVSVIGYASAFTLGGMPPYTYLWNTTPPDNDSIATFTNAGIYQLIATDSIGCMRTTSVLINGPDTSLTGTFDLNINLLATNFRTGFPATIWLDGFNDGCTSVSGQLSLILDTAVVYNSASPSPNAINGDTLIWNFANITYDSAHITPQIFLTVPATVQLGTQVCFTAIITPITGDADTTNNKKQYCFTVVNAYDPNDKKVYPTGECNAGYILNNQLLTYTVRFQNTGNADAINIYVLDSLDADLDLNTVRVIGKSHEPLITEVLPGNVLKFRFDSILLPDSLSNEPASHGYIIFEVLPKTNLTSGTLIKNNVGIYFDFNSPVYTNTVSNTVVNSIPVINTLVTQFSNTLTASATGVSYQWVDCNNGYSPINGETNQSFTATANGDYAVLINDSGCIDMSTCFNISTAGILNFAFSPSISISPNPTSGVFTIESTEKNYEVVITNVLGEQIQKLAIGNRQSATNSPTTIDLTSQPSGIYFVHIKTPDGVAVKKVVLQ